MENSAATHGNGRKPEILLVDDNEAFHHLFAVLYDRWFTVTYAPGVEEALALMGKRRFDAVVTDYEMPGGSGLDLLRAVKREYPLVPVVFYTGQGSEEVARDAFKEGAADYFVKDTGALGHTEKVARAVQRAVEQARMEAELRRHREHVDEIVLERAREFVELNEALRREIEERKRIEGELKRQSYLADTIIDRNPYSIQIYGKNGACVRANDASVRMWGVKPPPDYDAFSDMGKTYPEFIPLMKRMFEGEVVNYPPIFYNPRLMREDLPDNPTHAATVGFTLRDDQDEWEYAVLMHEDITARYLAEEALRKACAELRQARGEDDPAFKLVEEIERRRRSEEELLHMKGDYRTIVEASNDGIVICSGAAGETAEWNGRALELFGLTAAQMKTFVVADAALEREAFADAMRKAVRGEPHSGEWRMRGAGGRTFWADVSLARVSLGGRECVLAIVRDIDRRKRAERELEERNRELGDFAHRVSHDLKNQIMVLWGYFSMARKQPERLIVNDEDIQSAFRDIRTFMDDLLDLAAAGKVVDDDKKAPLDTERLIRSLFGILTASHGASLTDGALDAELRVDSPVPHVVGDGERLKEVFWNLIDNALKNRIPGAGTVAIEVRAARRDGFVEITVADDGKGILPEHLGRIFEPGFTKRAGGTCFGLAIVRKIVEAHGGKIAASSAGENKGAEFRLLLPAAEEK